MKTGERVAAAFGILGAALGTVYLIVAWGGLLVMLINDPLGTLGTVLFDARMLGPIGMDDGGRGILCNTLDAALHSEGVRVACAGRHSDSIIVSVPGSGRVSAAAIRLEPLLVQMKNPYQAFLRNFKGLTLLADRDTADKPIPIEQIETRAERLGVKSMADFLAACGFTHYIIRDPDRGRVLIELEFSAKTYGKNPIVRSAPSFQDSTSD